MRHSQVVSVRQRVIGPRHSVVRHEKSRHPPLVNAPIAQVTTSSRKTRESGQVCATQPERHERLNEGTPPPPPPKLKHENTHIRLSEHAFSSHMPQSVAQLTQSSSSSGSQRMLPQNEHEPQSAGQLEQFSVPEQRPSPQPGQRPQSR